MATSEDGNSDLSDISFLLPLTEHEMILKELYLSYPELETERFLDNEAFWNVFSALVPEATAEEFVKLGESYFFGDREDISMHMHDRYTPPFLHSHEFIEVIYVIQGTCLHRVQEETFSMSRGNICILAPSVTHGISAFSDDTIIFNMLLRRSTFEESFFDLLSEEDILSNFFFHMLYHSKARPYLYFATEDDRELRAIAVRILREVRQNRKYKKRMLNLMAREFFLVLLRNHEGDVVVPGEQETEESSILILKYMQEQYRTVTLAELSAFFHYSERQIQRRITEATGLSFTQNIQRLKVQHAKRLLVSSGRPVADIAEYLGYHDVVSFRRVFKKYTGMLPGEYREAEKPGADGSG